jgi:cyclic lactone autoinducer peptide
MKATLIRTLTAALFTFVLLVQAVAAMAAGAASYLGAYQPKVPEKLR